MIIFPILLILVLLVLGAGYYFYRVAFFPKRYQPDAVLSMEIKAGKLRNLEEYNAWHREEVVIHSSHGYKLNGLYFPLANSQKTVIFSHGITINHKGSIKYMPVFRALGFNCLIYDLRFHGGSGGPNCTFGYFEKDDLKTLVDWVINRTGKNTVIGTHGESLGAVITLQHASSDERISFAIADCPFSDLRQIFKLSLNRDYHLPDFPLLGLCRWYGKILAGVDFQQVSPISELNKTKTPILFIHGNQDGYIPSCMSTSMYQSRTSGTTRLYLSPGAKHAEAFSSNPAEYQKQVAAFLAEIGV
jgi:uncharacterized protein